MAEMFRSMLGSNESVFRDPVPLDYDYMPKVINFRRKEMDSFAAAIRPLLAGRSGRNMLVHGKPGVGKTAITKHMFKILDEESDNVLSLYINCWKHNTSYKVMLELCNLLGIRFVVNKKTSELFDLAKKKLNKIPVVFAFDEVDKAEDFDFLYMVLEDVYNKSVFLITNFAKKLGEFDERILSRLNPEELEFHPYSQQETAEILKYRLQYAFIPGAWEDDAFERVAAKTAQLKDIRTGLYILREAGTCAEERASRKIQLADVDAAIAKVDKYTKNAEAELDVELKEILSLVRTNEGAKIGDLYKKHQDAGGQISYKSFARKIKKLSDGQYLSTEKSISAQGNTTLVKFNKKLTEY